MKIFVCGGAGYIGSHLVREIQRHSKHSVVVLDNLSATKGSRAAVSADIPVEVGDVRDADFLDSAFAKHKPDAVVHMCASIVVPESVADPLMYYDNNIIGVVRLLQAMKKHDCKYVVFSSTAALFGYPERTPIEPDDPIRPGNPYGDTKHVAELLLKACDNAYGIKYVNLRYFNACGADRDGDIGECHDPETHLIPIVLQVPLGKRQHVTIFGNKYPTPDGTCVRDYIHITDLSTAHIQALEYLAEGNASDVFNLGNGKGYSVKEVIDVARKVTGHPIPAQEAENRPGDPPVLVASAEKAKKVLGWKPQYESLETIIESAWHFHKAQHEKETAKK